MSSKKVCVIGAGISGLASIKCCLEEGLDVICYDKTDSIGGLWSYKEEVIDSVGSVMKNTITNSSKEFSSFSDFPFPERAPNYMHHSLFLQYLQNYAKQFSLISHIHLCTEVIEVKKADDYETTGKWKIKTKTKNNDVKEEIFDCVMLCVGHHSHPNMPQYPGLDTFEGKVIHSHSYRKPDEFRDKRVLVVGIGNSGADIAVDLSSTAKKVYLSTRRGTWLIERRLIGGVPGDVIGITRMMYYALHYMGSRLANTFVEFGLNIKTNHSLYCLKPNHRALNQHLTCSDELGAKILTGFVTIKGDCHKFTKSGVIFADDYTRIAEVDVVILCTGYEVKFPFLESNVIDQIKNNVKLYKHVFPPHLKHPSLAAIGLIQPLGGGVSPIEIQCRWVSRVFKGLCRLPSENEMRVAINNKRMYIRKNYVDSDRHTFEENFIWYQDEIASLIGVKPDFRFMLLSDPKLFFYCLFGPILPYSYRLTGPHQWKGARGAILTAKDRIIKPLQTRKMPPSKSIYQSHLMWIGLLLIILFLWG